MKSLLEYITEDIPKRSKDIHKEDKDIHKRPMSKLVMDIAKELELIK